MAWEAPNRISVVEDINRENPGLIYEDDLEFCRLVICRCNQIPGEEGKWGFNAKRGNPNDKSRDVVTFANAEVPWGCSIVDIIANHPLPSSTPAWIDQTRATYNKGEVGGFIKADCTNTPIPEPGPDPEPEPPIPTPEPPVTCNFKETISREEFEALQARVDDTNTKVTEIKNKLFGPVEESGSLLDIITRLDRNLSRINDTGCKSPFQR